MAFLAAIVVLAIFSTLAATTWSKKGKRASGNTDTVPTGDELAVSRHAADTKRAYERHLMRVLPSTITRGARAAPINAFGASAVAGYVFTSGAGATINRFDVQDLLTAGAASTQISVSSLSQAIVICASQNWWDAGYTTQYPSFWIQDATGHGYTNYMIGADANVFNKQYRRFLFSSYYPNSRYRVATVGGAIITIGNSNDWVVRQPFNSKIDQNLFAQLYTGTRTFLGLGSLSAALAYTYEEGGAVYYGEWTTFPSQVTTVTSTTLTLDSTNGYTVGNKIVYLQKNSAQVFTITDVTGSVVTIDNSGGNVSGFDSATARAITMPGADTDFPGTVRTGLVTGTANNSPMIGVGALQAYMWNNDTFYKVSRTSDSIISAVISGYGVGADTQNGAVAAFTTTGADDVVVTIERSSAEASDSIWTYDDDAGTSQETAGARGYVASDAGLDMAYMSSGSGTAAGDPEVAPLIGPVYEMPHVVGAFRAFSIDTPTARVVCNTTFKLEEAFAYHDRVYFRVELDKTETREAEVVFESPTGPPTVVSDPTGLLVLNASGHVSGFSVSDLPLVGTTYPRAVTVQLQKMEQVTDAEGYLVRRRKHNWQIDGLRSLQRTFGAPTE